MVVTLNRPQRMNAMTLSMFFLLEQAWKEASADDDVRAIVLTGADGNFSSGMDLRSLVGDADEPDAVDTSAGDGGGPRLHLPGPAEDLPPTKPVIAAVEGNAIAGGTEILQGTDIRVAAESAKFGVSEARWSLYPMGARRSGCAARSPTPSRPTSCSPASTSPPTRPRTSDSSATSCPTARPWTRRRRSPRSSASTARWPSRPSSDPAGDRVNVREGRLRARVVVRARGDVLRGREGGPQAFKEKRTPTSSEDGLGCPPTSRSPTRCWSGPLLDRPPSPLGAPPGRRPWPGTPRRLLVGRHLRRGAWRRRPSPTGSARAGDPPHGDRRGVREPADDDAHRPSGAHRVPQAGRPGVPAVADRCAGGHGPGPGAGPHRADHRRRADRLRARGVRAVPRSASSGTCSAFPTPTGRASSTGRGDDPRLIAVSQEEREAVQQEMRAYFLAVIAEAGVEPGEDLISTLTEVKIDDDSSPTMSCTCS